MDTRKKTCMIVSTLVMIIAIVVIGPLDYFTHGFFYEEIDCEQILAEDYHDTINLENDYYEMAFSPQKPHMVGFEIYIINQPDGNTGTLRLAIIDNKGKEIDCIDVDLSKVKAASWYKVYTSASLKKGEEYTVRFSAEGCDTIPHLQNVDSSYLPEETIAGNILLVYAYADSTFTFQNKIIIALFIIAIWGFACTLCMEGKTKSYVGVMAACIFMTAVLTWNYMYNSMDNQNGSFSSFQVDSETLVASVIYANDNASGFGLGRYDSLKGGLWNYELSYLSDDDWLDGYSKTQPAIIVNSNTYSREVAAVGNSIAFDNGEVFRITNIECDSSYIIIYLDTYKILPPAKYGSLDDVTFFDQNNQQFPNGHLTAYKSQYGLQGKVFRHLVAAYTDKEQAVDDLHLLCSIASAIVFVLIVVLIAAKYNEVLAGCFFITFWLSPWIVNFARNLYWVEYTWFLPMTVGLFCAWKVDNRKCRIISYISAFIAILGKSLCGYEYISTVMMGLIAFLLVDCLLAALKKDKKKAELIFRTMFILGTIAIVGFIVAICIHASLRGDGSIVEGMKNIIKEDVLRRTNGDDLNEFSPNYWQSFNASIWETFNKYFHFNTEVIAGIAGNLFPLLCMIPLCVFGYEYKTKTLNIELASMYVVFFLTSISWFCLAKSHSYIHTHMNYVLWYFGFVQICIYVIVNKIIGAFRWLRLKEQRGDSK